MRAGSATTAGPALLCLLVAVLAGCGASGQGHRPRTSYGPEGVAVEHGRPLGPAPAATGRPVAGIPCRKPAKPHFHVHAHLAVYVDGRLRPVPAGIGMVAPRTKHTRSGAFLEGPRCYYDLHTHAADGVVHVEGPAPRVYTLGQFFALWRLPLSADRVGPAGGRVTVYVDGRLATTPPQQIPLTQRSVIQLDVGTPVPPRPVDWSHF